MEQRDVLKELFDDKIIKIINIFLENPKKQFSLTQVSFLSKVNIATTLRILEKLVKQNIIELIIIGKSKLYKIKNTEKTLFLSRFLKNEEEPLLEFIDRVKNHPRIKKIIAEAKTGMEAKLILVGNFLPTDKINAIVDDIKRKYRFDIHFVEITEKQFSDMEKARLYDLGKKIAWEREEEK